MLLKDQLGRAWKVHFYHEAIPVDDNAWVRASHRTSCAIHLDRCVRGEDVGKLSLCQAPDKALGVTECSRRDEFRKVDGRKIALFRAMVKAGIPRDIRESLWLDYFSKSPIPERRAS